MKNKDNQTTVRDRMKIEQGLLVEQLKKTPIVQVACEKVDVGRATYYRWRKENEEFTKLADDAISEGNFLVNDMAESQLMSAIKDKNMTAIIFWLKHHHPAYLTRVEITSSQAKDPTLTAEQEESVKKALLMAGIIKPEVQKTENER
jgi:hypothetical protein